MPLIPTARARRHRRRRHDAACGTVRRFQAIGRLSPGLIERNEVGKYAIANVRPLAAPLSRDRYAAGELLSTPGLHLSQIDQEELIREIGRQSDLLATLRSSSKINTQHHQVGDKIRNGFFPTPDAETYAPDPRTDVSAAASRVIRQRVEHAGLKESGFPPPSILFIDSSHILRTGGDLPFLFGELVPTLPSGVTVHVHDIYLPFDYSQLGVDLWWTEQYLLRTLLSHNPRYRVDLALRWMTAVNPALMAEVFGPIVATEAAHGGGSFWFTTV